MQTQAEQDSLHGLYPDRGGTSLGNNFALPSKPKVSEAVLKLAQPKGAAQVSNRRSRTIEPFLITADAEDIGAAPGLYDLDEYDKQVVGEEAAWCIPPAYTQEPQTRRLYGELHLPPGLQPTCKFPLFSVLVSMLFDIWPAADDLRVCSTE